MRTGLIPNAHPTIESASTPLDAPRSTAGLRHHLHVRAGLLDSIQQAAAAGDETAVIELASHLYIARRHTPLHKAA